ncbi:hypothetical protein [Pediococcus claussenii]|uniref:Membrane protein n=1 Tax=Pediococcus claussenii (strain ATCC BAA-344 / DSM 14800 / JCM 18046 / KCTC 3811 / LMG 21948 / P06) TaxID=701521 RepID=G8PAQ8_PEDCP|nr:hypothetical protein [Pediococcus claussenii]AEV94617.1 putative membrane protein [Pediococcus claussenii ATCC BAA-344]ANZ69821.1 hypothetical protein AYR57_05645 [Pediococcus claussenii]ANZ71638.1 hypothetical protein AYR58_05650 [Pediococcus claussenii]KRN20797.1 hypothetical protein IV79_GL000017 [Pediococcus claussenii]
MNALRIVVYSALWALNIGLLLLINASHFNFELILFALTIPIATLFFILITRRGNPSNDLTTSFWSFNINEFNFWEKALIVVAIVSYLVPLKIALWITALVAMILIGDRLKRKRIGITGSNMFRLLWQLLIFNLFFMMIFLGVK